jgi:hypothetical protein
VVVAATAPGARTATVPLGLPVWVVGVDPAGSLDGVAAAPCGSCR